MPLRPFIDWTGMSGRLEGRGAIITGGATGIGRAIAERLVADGAGVAIGQLDARPYTAPAGAELWELDVRDTTAVEAFISRADAELGGLRISGVEMPRSPARPRLLPS